MIMSVDNFDKKKTGCKIKSGTMVTSAHYMQAITSVDAMQVKNYSGLFQCSSNFSHTLPQDDRTGTHTHY